MIHNSARSLVGLAVLATGMLLFSITSLASPETSGAVLLVVDVNVAHDPDGHAEHIGMSAQLTLNLDIDSQTGDITIDNVDGTGWVSVSGAIEGGQIFASGSGKVAGFQNIAVIFEGTLDLDGGLSGQYRMGTDGGLPPDILGNSHPIKYTLKPRGVCPGGRGAAGCPPPEGTTETPTATPTPTLPAPEPPTATPTPTAPEASATPAPTSTPRPTDHIDFGCENETSVSVEGNQDIIGGDDGIQIHCGLDYELPPPSDSTGEFDFNRSEIVVQPNGFITGEEHGIDIELDCTDTSFDLSLPDLIRSIETRCRAIFRAFVSPFGGAGNAPSAIYESLEPITLTANSAFPPFGATLESGPIDVPLVVTGSQSVVGSITRLSIEFSPYGDVNCNVVANSIDAALVLQFVAALLQELDCQRAGDVDRTGEADAVDVALILQFVAGLLPNLPVGSSPTPVPFTPMPTSTPVPSATPLAPTTVPSPMPTDTPPPAPTATNTPPPTPTSTATPDTGKVSITIEGGPSRRLEVFQGDDCTGSPFASVTASGSLSLSFSPGSYSIMAADIAGWELVVGVEACQNVEIVAGQKSAITFTYQQVP